MQQILCQYEITVHFQWITCSNVTKRKQIYWTATKTHSVMRLLQSHRIDFFSLRKSYQPKFPIQASPLALQTQHSSRQAACSEDERDHVIGTTFRFPSDWAPRGMQKPKHHGLSTTSSSDWSQLCAWVSSIPCSWSEVRVLSAALYLWMGKILNYLLVLL